MQSIHLFSSLLGFMLTQTTLAGTLNCRAVPPVPRGTTYVSVQPETRTFHIASREPQCTNPIVAPTTEYCGIQQIEAWTATAVGSRVGKDVKEIQIVLWEDDPIPSTHTVNDRHYYPLRFEAPQHMIGVSIKACAIIDNPPVTLSIQIINWNTD